MYKLIPWILALALAAGYGSRLGAVTPLSDQTKAVGQLLNVAGNVEVQRANPPLLKGTLLFQLQAGDTITVHEGGSAEVVLFKNGARFLLFAGSSARVEQTRLTRLSGPAPQSLAKLSKDFVTRMNTPPKQVSPKILGVLVRGRTEATLGPRNPSPNGAVRDAAVTLRWAGPIEGEQLRLRISDGENTVQHADLPPTAHEFKVPDGVLRPGEYYVWSVTAVRGGDSGPTCRALVRVLLPNERAELERMEREVAKARQLAPDDPAPSLLLAQAYERFGLFDEAMSAYEAVLRLRPNDAGVQAALKRLAAKD